MIVHDNQYVCIVGAEDVDIEHYDPKKSDPEYFVYECLNIEEVDKLLNETVELLCSILKCTQSLAKNFLLEHKWCLNEIVSKYRDNPNGPLVRIIDTAVSFQFNFANAIHTDWISNQV